MKHWLEQLMPNQERTSTIITLAFFSLIATIFLVANITTAAYFAPWTDEIMQIDAGVNLYLGNGWKSTAWQSQSQQEFWAANNPLYPLLIYFWIKLFGFSLVSVRSLNYVLALAVTWILVDTAKRAGFIRSVWGNVALILLLLCDHAFAFVYRSGRADVVTMLVAACLFRVYLIVSEPRRRVFWLFVISMFMLASGLHVIPYVVLILAFAIFVTRSFCSHDLIAIGSGCASGALILAAIFAAKHSLSAFVLQTVASGYNVLGAAVQAVLIRDDQALNRFMSMVSALSPLSVLRTLAADRSIVPLLFFLVCAALMLRKPKHAQLQRNILHSLLIAILIPYGMLAAGRYAFYYAWMGAVPSVCAFVFVLEQLWVAEVRTWVMCGIVATLVSILVGLPWELNRQIHDLSNADYRHVDAMVRSEATPIDSIYGDPIAYYAAKAMNVAFFSVTYGGGRRYPQISKEEKSRISLLIVRPEQTDESLARIGGNWIRHHTYSLPYGPLLTYRRAP